MTETKKPAPLSPSPNTFQLAEHKRNLWTVEIPAGVPIGRVVEPDFWVHLTKMLKPNDKIEARAQDGAWYAELLVDKIEPQAVRVWKVLYSDRSATAKSGAVADDFKVEFGGAHKWRVVRLSDKEVLHKGEADETAARAWLEEHIATTA